MFTVLAALSGMEREYIRDRTLEGHESARKRGKTIGDAGVTDDAMLSMALHLRGLGRAFEPGLDDGDVTGQVPLHPAPQQRQRGPGRAGQIGGGGPRRPRILAEGQVAGGSQ